MYLVFLSQLATFNSVNLILLFYSYLSFFFFFLLNLHFFILFLFAS